MALVTTPAVVLQTYRYSETSKVVRLATRELGVQSAIAKGALRPKSRFGAGLELLSEGSAQLYFHEARELHTLDRKSTRLNSSHSQISYAVFCLKKKKKTTHKRVARALCDPLSLGPDAGMMSMKAQFVSARTYEHRRRDWIPAQCVGRNDRAL